VAEPGRKSNQGHDQKGVIVQTAKTQVEVEIYPDDVIDQTIDDAAFAASSAGQSGQLAIRIIERIGQNMKDHAGNVDA